MDPSRQGLLLLLDEPNVTQGKDQLKRRILHRHSLLISKVPDLDESSEEVKETETVQVSVSTKDTSEEGLKDSSVSVNAEVDNEETAVDNTAAGPSTKVDSYGAGKITKEDTNGYNEDIIDTPAPSSKISKIPDLDETSQEVKETATVQVSVSTKDTSEEGLKDSSVSVNAEVDNEETAVDNTAAGPSTKVDSYGAGKITKEDTNGYNEDIIDTPAPSSKISKIPDLDETSQEVKETATVQVSVSTKDTSEEGLKDSSVSVNAKVDDEETAVENTAAGPSTKNGKAANSQETPGWEILDEVDSYGAEFDGYNEDCIDTPAPSSKSWKKTLKETLKNVKKSLIG